jgi:hypothetical protein
MFTSDDLASFWIESFHLGSWEKDARFRRQDDPDSIIMSPRHLPHHTAYTIYI